MSEVVSNGGPDMRRHAEVPVLLTPASHADIEFIFLLKSEPEAVYWGGFAAPPERAGLQRHLEHVLAQGSKTLLIVRAGGEPAGLISCRLAADGECVDYSINISNRFAGQGLGRAALLQHAVMLAALPHCQRIVALIRADNPRSQRIFGECGYTKTGDFEERMLSSDPQPIRLDAWVKALAPA